MLNITMRTRGVTLTPEEDGAIRKRVWFALDRFAPKISAVEVRLEDLNGPRGGTDKECQITALLRDGPSICVADRDSRTKAAARRACERVRAGIRRLVAVRRSRETVREG